MNLQLFRAVTLQPLFCDVCTKRIGSALPSGCTHRLSSKASSSFFDLFDQHMSPRPQANRHRFALALLFIAPALWAVNYLVARSAPGVIEPHLLAALRWLMAAVLFSVGNWAELREHRTQILQDWKHYLVLGALGMWICGAWVYIGGRTTVAVNIALIYAISPVLIVAASALWLKERITAVQLCGVLLALVDVLHVILKGQWNNLAAVQFVAGDGWVLAAAVSWAAYSLLLKKWHSPLSASARLSVISLSGVLVMLPFTVFEAIQNPLPVLTVPGFGLALAAAIIPGYGAYLAFSVMQRELGAARVSVTLYLGPIYAAVIAWAVLGEPLRLHHCVGMALVLVGIYGVNRKG
jgi:drug/metabolite transporter (DMT)-like permease